MKRLAILLTVLLSLPAIAMFDGDQYTPLPDGGYQCHGGSGDCQYSFAYNGESHWETTWTEAGTTRGNFVYITPTETTALVLHKKPWTYSDDFWKHLYKAEWQPYESGYGCLRYNIKEAEEAAKHPTMGVLTGGHR